MSAGDASVPTQRGVISSEATQRPERVREPVRAGDESGASVQTQRSETEDAAMQLPVRERASARGCDKSGVDAQSSMQCGQGVQQEK